MALHHDDVVQRTRNYDDVTHANPAFVLQRQRYLAKIADAREEGRLIYYQDESWINAHMQRHKEMRMPEWDEDLDVDIPEPKSGKGARSILCGIGSADDPNGFLGDTFLLYRGKKSNKSDDYHTDMNADVFLDWMEKKVLPAMPKLPQKAAIIIDRASYHMTKTDGTRMPVKDDTKGAIVDWLEKKGIVIPHPDWDGTGRATIVPYRAVRKNGAACMGCTKRYLWTVVQENRIIPRYKVVDLVEKYPRTDIKVIILPVHHPELNPIELMWNQIKYHVRSNNVELRQEAAEGLVKEKVASLKQDAWTACLRHVRKVEDLYRKEEEMEDEGILDVEGVDEEVE